MALANFNRALAFTLKYEGGKSDDPRDPGGRTNQGVTQRTYDAYRKSKGLAQQDVYAMLPSVRDEIYKYEYWGKVTGDSLPPGVDLCVFDYAVNSGPDRALRTYASVGHSKKPADAIHAVCSSRLSFLHALRTWSFFGIGWARRVAACEVEALKVAGLSLGKAHDKVKSSGSGRSSLFVTALAAMGTLVGLSWQELSKGYVGIIAVVGVILFIAHCYNRRSTTIRTEVLSAAVSEEKTINKEEDLKLAMARMQAASEDMTHVHTLPTK